MKFTYLFLLFACMLSGQDLKQKVAEQQIIIDSLQAKIDLLNLDIDEDGVSDHFDKCPETPKGARIDGSGCPLDIDLDGIIDLNDNCVTMPGEASNNGCPIYSRPIIPDYATPEFEYRASEIDNEHLPAIKHVSDIIEKYGKGKTYGIVVYSTEMKTDKANFKLSKKRAENIYQWLVEFNPSLKNQLQILPKGSSDLPYPECKDYEKCQGEGALLKNRQNNRLEITEIKNEL